MPFFSVVLITYNRADLLPRCIDSVINQTFKDWELIIVDNYSEDGSKELIENYMSNESRISLIQVHNNNVLAYSRNIGIRAARGKYICILDSDDWYTTDKLQVVFDVCMHGDYDVIYNSYQQVTERGMGRICGKSLKTGDVFYELLENGPIICNTTTVVKKASIEKVGYLSEDPKLRAVEDLDLWLRLAQMGCVFFFINKCLGYYWIGSNMSYSLGQICQINNLFDKFYPEIKKEKLSECHFCQYFLSARICHKIGEFSEANKYYLEALKLSTGKKKIRTLIMLYISKFGIVV